MGMIGHWYPLLVAAIMAQHSPVKDKTKIVEASPTDNFTRAIYSGTIEDMTDSFPPSKVTDLKVVAADSVAGTVTLTWTAPGDDFHTGKASRYDIRIANTSESFKRDFTKSKKVEPDMILPGTGSLSPKSGGSIERMVVKTPASWTTVYFALTTLDEVNHVSETSNTAMAKFKDKALIGPRTTTTISTTTIKTKQIVEDTSNTVLIVAIVVPVVIVCVASFVAVLLIKVYFIKKKTKINYEQTTEPSHFIPDGSS